jgi:hypothetical protein
MTRLLERLAANATAYGPVHSAAVICDYVRVYLTDGRTAEVRSTWELEEFLKTFWNSTAHH